MTTPTPTLLDYTPSQEETKKPMRLNNVTFELREDKRGRFVVDVRVSRDGGKPVTAGSYTSYETVEKAIERGLQIARQYLTPTEIDYSDDDESGTTPHPTSAADTKGDGE